MEFDGTEYNKKHFSPTSTPEPPTEPGLCLFCMQNPCVSPHICGPVQKGLKNTKPPTEPGWYWFYDDKIQEWDCIHVRFTENYIKNEVELVADTYHKVYVEDIKCELVSEMKGQWQGPIKKPDNEG